MRPYEFAKASGVYAQTTSGYASVERDGLEQLLYANVDADLLLNWPIEAFGKSKLHYPLSPVPFDSPEEADGGYYEFQLHFGKDFIYHTSEEIDPFEPPPKCVCGQDLVYGLNDPIFWAERIARYCPICNREFDITGRECTGRDGWTGKSLSIPGGVAYRFALVVDCGKCFGNKPLQLNLDLRRLVESVLGITLYEVADFY